MIYTEAITILHVKHGTSKEEVKKAFFKLAHIHHPDKGGSATKFVEIKKAYDFLMVTDPPKVNTHWSKPPTGGRNPFTGDWEEYPPTTAHTRTRSYATSDNWSDRQAERMRLQQDIINKKVIINKMEMELRDVKFQLSMLEWQLRDL